MMNNKSTQAWPPMVVHFSYVSQASAMAVREVYLGLDKYISL